MKARGVIVAAGYGSRFLPATKTVPKEMLPLIDRPAIDFIVDELVAAGIRDILIISSRRKKALEDYFDREVELETAFASQRDPAKRERLLAAIAPPDVRVSVVRQQVMAGTGHALRLASDFAGSDPVIVAYPDDLVFGDVSLSRQLLDAHEHTGCSVLAVQPVAGDVSRYGVIEPSGEGNPVAVRRLVEKPAPGEEPSKLVGYGRYLFTPDFFEHLETGYQAWRDAGASGEFYHVDAINRLGASQRLVALTFEGTRLDVGDPAGYLEAMCRYALMRNDLADSARELFRNLAR